MAILPPTILSMGHPLPTGNCAKKAKKSKTENVTQKALAESGQKWMQRSEKIKDCVINCFTWGPVVPAISSFVIGLVVCVAFPYFAIGAAVGTAAAFALAGLAWAGTYLVGALLMLLAKACEAQAS